MSALYTIAGTVLLAVLGGIAAWIKQDSDQHTGAALEAGKASAVAARTEAAIAQAEVAAPVTREAVADRLAKGTF